MTVESNPYIAPQVIYQKLEDALFSTVEFSTVNYNTVCTLKEKMNYPCPHGYCRCFVRTIIGPMSCDYVMDSNSSNRQCNCDREGEWVAR